MYSLTAAIGKLAQFREVQEHAKHPYYKHVPLKAFSLIIKSFSRTKIGLFVIFFNSVC